MNLLGALLWIQVRKKLFGDYVKDDEEVLDMLAAEDLAKLEQEEASRQEERRLERRDRVRACAESIDPELRRQIANLKRKFR
jgi:hypothetical protein